MMMMKFPVRVAIAFSACVLPGLVAAQAERVQAPGARAACPSPIFHVLGSTTAAEFSVEDCSAQEDGNKRVIDFYGIRADTRRDLFVVVEAPAMDVRLSLWNEDGIEVAADGFTGAFTFISTQVPAGLYLLQLESRGGSPDARLHGRYTLRSSSDQVGFEGCPRTDTLQAGSSISGEWSVEDCRIAVNTRWDLHYFDYYRLRVDTARDVALELASPGINSILTLFSADGAPLASADAFGVPGRLSSQLAPGEYVVRVGVASVSPRETGQYTLRIR